MQHALLQEFLMERSDQRLQLQAARADSGAQRDRRMNQRFAVLAHRLAADMLLNRAYAKR
jgi:hypothetical protein